MMGEPGLDYPDEKMPIDLRAESRADTLMSFVEYIDDGELVLSVGEDRQRRRVSLELGEHLELLWRGPDEFRAVPAELVAVETGDRGMWRVRTVGPAARGQRRAAVRAPLDCRLTLTAEGRTLEGVSVDLSEGGVRCLLADAADAVAVSGAAEDPTPGGEQAGADTDGATDARLQVGSIQQVTVWFDDRDYITANGEVIRHHPREDKREEVSIRFIGLPEKMEDFVRARVFARLRDLRARGLL